MADGIDILKLVEIHISDEKKRGKKIWPMAWFNKEMEYKFYKAPIIMRTREAHVRTRIKKRTVGQMQYNPDQGFDF